ncbi:MAG: hypothetical protein ACT4P7_12860 [Gemmatimonadaceae bacterium]
MRLPWTVSISLALLAGAWRTQAPLRLLGNPREFPEPFTRVSSVRELRDGRVLMADRRDQSLILLDFQRGTQTAVSRRGAGPREYQLPDQLLPMPGDSTWLWDPMNDRWLVLDPTGVPVTTRPARETTPRLRFGEPLGVDRAGFVYARVTDADPRNPAAGATGHAVVLRMDRRADHVDSVVRLRVPAGRVEGARALPNGMIRRINNRPLAAEDVAAVAPDGRVVVVRVPEYRVERHGVGVEVTRGQRIPYEPIPVTAAERRAFIAAQTMPGRILMGTSPSARAAHRSACGKRSSWPNVAGFGSSCQCTSGSSEWCAPFPVEKHR